MPDQDPLDEWLKDFHKEIDATVFSSQPADDAAASSGPESFADWWKPEQQSVGGIEWGSLEEKNSVKSTFPESGERLLSADWPARLERLAEEKAQLQQHLSEISRENIRLRERQARIQSEIADFETKTSRSREGYENHIARLSDRIGMLEDQIKTYRESNVFLEQSFSRLESDSKRLEDDLRLERQKNEAHEKRSLELKERIAESEAVIMRLREDLAAKVGSLEELRRLVQRAAGQPPAV